MQFVIQKEHLFPALQKVIGVVERKQHSPVLANILVDAHEQNLRLTATDNEIELSTSSHPAQLAQQGTITLPARKLFDLCRTLPEDSELNFKLQQQRMVVKTNNSRFTLSTLPAEEFPRFSTDTDPEFTLSCNAQDLAQLFAQTAFAMAQQDIRYYLNGTLLEFMPNKLSGVATDGHRLALSWIALIEHQKTCKVILPRKAVNEMLRLLNENEQTVDLVIGTNYLRLSSDDFVFTTRLIAGSFPNYQKVIPKDCDKAIVLDRELLRDLLARAAVLTNEKHRGVLLQLENGKICLQARNNDQDQAEIENPIDYQGEAFAIGFNISYLQDALNVIDEEQVKLSFSSPMSGFLAQGVDNEQNVHVIMPMRL